MSLAKELRRTVAPGQLVGGGRGLRPPSRHDRIVAAAVVAGVQALDAVTEFILSCLMFLTVAAVLIALHRDIGLRCMMAPLICSCPIATGTPAAQPARCDADVMQVPTPG
jgi:hypothetical protein